MVDYSKWDHIEISDDEDDTHPNIDTPSLYRWRHQARVERMEEMEQEKKKLDTKVKENKRQLEQLREKMSKVDVSQKEETKKKLEQTEKEQKKLRQEEEEFHKKEKKAPKNVDTLSHEGFTKTIINKPKPKKNEELSEEEQAKKSQEFMDKHEPEIKHFGMLQDYNDSQDYLIKNPHLACDDTANYLALWCINLEVQEKHALVERVAHQTIIMQYILELAKSLETDPKNTLTSFFRKIVRAKSEFKEYMDAFDDELDSFKKRVKERAEARIEKAMKEAEEEERQERLGPGGLDPVEVFDTLPKSLQECFEKKDIPMLQEVLGKMPEDQARHWLKQCVDSGLWIANAKEAEELAKGGAAQAEGGEEETYEEVNGAAEK